MGGGKGNCQSLCLYNDVILRLMAEAGVHRENHIVSTTKLSILVVSKRNQIYLTFTSTGVKIQYPEQHKSNRIVYPTFRK